MVQTTVRNPLVTAVTNKLLRIVEIREDNRGHEKIEVLWRYLGTSRHDREQLAGLGLIIEGSCLMVRLPPRPGAYEGWNGDEFILTRLSLPLERAVTSSGGATFLHTYCPQNDSRAINARLPRGVARLVQPDRQEFEIRNIEWQGLPRSAADLGLRR